jgi:hypothetical protein
MADSKVFNPDVRISNTYNQLVNDIKKPVLHSLYPYDFEVYLMSIELVDSDGLTVDYFAWPVMPINITKSEMSRINVKKTASAVTVISSSSFTPHNLSIKGDFGRTFKILFRRNQPLDFKAFRFSIFNGVRNKEDLDNSKPLNLISEFNPEIKTGYACIKIMQSIIDKSSGVDAKGKPFKLHLYNPAIGESYIVVPSKNPLVLEQNNQTNNMIWSYSLNLVIVSPLQPYEFENDKKISLKRKLSSAEIQNAVGNLGRSVGNFVKSSI